MFKIIFSIFFLICRYFNGLSLVILFFQFTKYIFRSNSYRRLSTILSFQAILLFRYIIISSINSAIFIFLLKAICGVWYFYNLKQFRTWFIYVYVVLFILFYILCTNIIHLGFTIDFNIDLLMKR